VFLLIPKNSDASFISSNCFCFEIFSETFLFLETIPSYETTDKNLFAFDGGKYLSRSRSLILKDLRDSFFIDASLFSSSLTQII